jgi:hypothetical protein
MWVYLPWASRLPSAYQEVEWIEWNWTQRIDTWVTPTSSTKSQIKFRNLWVTWNVIYWFINWNDSADYRFFNYNSQIYFDLNSSRIYGSSCNANTDYEFEIWNNYVKNVWASSNLVSWSSVSWYAWASTIKLNYNEDNFSISSNRRYYIKIRDWVTQVRDFIPCYRKSDSVIWLYDLVNSQFYTNAWSWTFTKWSNVSWGGELSNAFIGYAYSPWENTIAYFPLSVSTTTKEQSWKWYQLTTSWSVSFWTYWWVSCCTINNGMLYTQLSSAVSSANWLTMNIWYYETSAPTNDNATLTWMTANTPTWWSVVPIWILRAKWRPNSRQWLIWYLDTYQNNAWTAYSTVASSVSTWRWYNVWVTYQWTTVTLYVNWSSVWTVSASDAVANKNYIAISRSIDANRSLIWYVSEAIYEKWVWNATKMAKHYNWMKSLYWLS